MSGEVTLQSGTQRRLLQPCLAAAGTTQCGSRQVMGAGCQLRWEPCPDTDMATPKPSLLDLDLGPMKGEVWESRQGNSPRPPTASETHPWGSRKAWGRGGGGPLGKPQNPALGKPKGSSFIMMVSRATGAWLSAPLVCQMPP